MKEYFEFQGFNDDLFLDKNDDLFLDKKENYSNFKGDPVTAIAGAVGNIAGSVGQIADASARKKEAKAKIIEIGGKREAQKKACEDNKAYKKFLDRKYRRNRIKDCQEEVKKRLDAEEKEQNDIVKRTTAIEENKLTNDFKKSEIDLKKSETNISETKSSKKLYVVAGLVALFLVLGTIVFLKKKS